MTNIEDTTTSAVASVASKSTIAGASASTIGWLTADRYVALGGLAVAVLGFIVNVLFRWLHQRAVTRRHADEEARARELHDLKLKVLNARLAQGGKGDDALDTVAELTP